MNKKSKVMLILLVLLISLSLLNGCADNKNNENVTMTNQENNKNINDQDNSNNIESTNEPTDVSKQNSADDSATSNTTKVAEDETKELSIYTIDEDTLETTDYETMIPANSEITPELIVNEVVKSFDEIDLKIGIDSITKKDDTVIVSFKSDAAPFTNTGAGVEESILDAIGMSLIDNLKDYNKVVFRVEGKAYESGHMCFGINEVYIEN